jgi:hypothetical protein
MEVGDLRRNPASIRHRFRVRAVTSNARGVERHVDADYFSATIDDMAPAERV